MKQCSTPLFHHHSWTYFSVAFPDRRAVVRQYPHVILTMDNRVARREMETLLLRVLFHVYIMLSHSGICFLRDQYVRFLCARCLARCGYNGLNHSRSARGGWRGAIHVGTNRLGDSWPNVVVVGGKETGRREEEREEWMKVKGEKGRKQRGCMIYTGTLVLAERTAKFQRPFKIFIMDIDKTTRLTFSLFAFVCLNEFLFRCVIMTAQSPPSTTHHSHTLHFTLNHFTSHMQTGFLAHKIMQQRYNRK